MYVSLVVTAMASASEFERDALGAPRVNGTTTS